MKIRRALFVTIFSCIAFLYECESKGIEKGIKRQQDNSINGLYLISRTEPEEQFAYVNSHGDTIIPFGKYSMCYTDTFYNFAIVLKDDDGFVGINRKEEVLFKVYPFDNGPDYISNGTMRIIKDELIGYADTNGEILISPKYNAALPFSEGLAGVCIGCKKVQDGEHFRWSEGKWGFINKKGEMVIEPSFDNVQESFQNGVAEVSVGSKTTRINKNGVISKITDSSSIVNH